MGTFDTAPIVRLRGVRGGFRAQYELDAGMSRELAGSIERQPVHWWHPLLRTNSRDLEPARFVVRDEQGTVRCVATRPGGTLRAGRIELASEDGTVLARLRRAGWSGRSGFELRDAHDVVIGRMGGPPNPVSPVVDGAGHPVGALEVISRRGGIVAAGLGRIEGVQRSAGRLLTSDPGEVGTLLTFEALATPLLRMVVIVAAVHYRS